MFTNYRSIFAVKGAIKFSIAGFIARMHLSMDRLALLLIIIHETNSYSLAGIMVATASVVITISQPYWSRAADIYGQSRILYINTFLRFLSFSFFIYLVHFKFPIWSWFVAIILAELNTVSAGGLVRRRWIMVLPDPKLKNTAYSFEALVDEIVFIFGPLIATTLSTYIFPEAGLLASMSFVLIGQPLLGSLKTTEPPRKFKIENDENVSIIKRSVTQAIIIPIFFVGAYFGSVGITVVAYANSMKHSNLTGALLAIWALGSAIAAIINGATKWHLTHAQLFIYSLNFLLFVSFALLAVKSVYVLAIILFINGLGISPVLVNAYATMEESVSERELTEAMTWVTTGTPTGGAIGSAIAGRIIDKFNATSGFWVPISALLIANLALLPYLKVWIRLRSRP
jgi:MFS family permease